MYAVITYTNSHCEMLAGNYRQLLKANSWDNIRLVAHCTSSGFPTCSSIASWSFLRCTLEHGVSIVVSWSSEAQTPCCESVAKNTPWAFLCILWSMCLSVVGMDFLKVHLSGSGIDCNISVNSVEIGSRLIVRMLTPFVRGLLLQLLGFWKAANRVVVVVLAVNLLSFLPPEIYLVSMCSTTASILAR